MDALRQGCVVYDGMIHDRLGSKARACDMTPFWQTNYDSHKVL